MDTTLFLGEIISGFRAGRPGGNPLPATYADPLGDSFLKPLCLHALSFVRCPEGASELELSGVWFAFFALILGGRPSLATKELQGQPLGLVPKEGTVRVFNPKQTRATLQQTHLSRPLRKTVS